jgi:hypothetical protein
MWPRGLKHGHGIVRVNWVDIYIYIYMDKKNSAIFMPLDVFSVVKVIVMMAKMVCFNLVNYLKLELSKPTLYKVNH